MDRQKILVVDDENRLRKLVKDWKQETEARHWMSFLPIRISR